MQLSFGILDWKQGSWRQGQGVQVRLLIYYLVFGRSVIPYLNRRARVMPTKLLSAVSQIFRPSYGPVKAIYSLEKHSRYVPLFPPGIRRGSSHIALH